MKNLHHVILCSLISIARISSQTWSVDQILKPSDGGSYDNFGRSLAIEKDIIAVGAPLNGIHGTKNQGSVYIFERNGTSGWTETAKITPQLDETQYFGYTVVIQGNTIVAGARFDDVNGAFGNGEAYVFMKNATTGNWTEVQRLSEPKPQTNAHFGDGMAIDDRTLVIGESGTNNYEGALHVYVRPNTEWVLQTVLYPPRAFGVQEEFGTSVDIHGNWAVAGAKQVQERRELPGYAMIFHRDEQGEWDEGFLIQPDESTGDDEFGRSVTIQGDIVVVARKSDSFIFKRTGTATYPNEWAQVQKIDSGMAVQLGGDGLLLTSGFVYSQDSDGKFVPMNQKTLNYGGPFSGLYNVAISGNTVLIGEPYSGNGGIVTVASTTALADGTLAPVSPPFSLSPTAMPVPSQPSPLATNRPTLFLQQASQWISFQELTASDGMPADNFGYGVAIDGKTLVAGAYTHSVNGKNSGAAYVFELENGAWRETQKLISDDPDDSDYFARAVAINGNQIAIGARFANNGRGDFGSGRVYVFLKDESTGKWSQSQMLEDVYGETNGHFGDAVAFDENFLLVGEPGVRQAHVYVSIGGGQWKLSTTLLPDRPALEGFGGSVAIEGRTAVVGAPSDYPHYRPGFVMIYTFIKDVGWSSGFKLQSLNDAAERDNFGSSVGIEGNTLVVAAKQSTYIFEVSEQNNETSWKQVQKVDGGPPVALNGDYLLVGQKMYTKLGDGVWRIQQSAELRPTQGSPYIYTADISENFAVLGHPFINDAGLVSIYQNRRFVQPTESPSLVPTSVPTSVPTIPLTPESTVGTLPPNQDTKAPSLDRNTAGDQSSSLAVSSTLSGCMTLFILPLLL